MKNINDFSKCKVGDKLWSIELGECEVTKLTDVLIHCINLGHRQYDYYHDGRSSCSDVIQSLYFSNPNIIAPEKPKEKIPFDLEKALSGEYDLVTRDGIKVQEWKWFENANQNEECISFAVNNELCNTYLNGNYWPDKSSYDYDLFLIEK